MEAFPLDRPARLAVFASGRGTNLASLLRAFPQGNALGSVVLVVSDRAAAPALARARAVGVEALHIPWPRGGRAAFEARAQEALEARGIDLVCLAGFMRILSPAFVEAWAGRILNIHPSLLPDFPGLHAQRQALEAGAREAGCSVHFVDAGVDSGPVVLQRRVPVFPGDTEATLAARILHEEHRAYPDAVRLVLEGWAFPPPDAAFVRERYGPEAAAVYAALEGRTPEGAPRTVQYLRVARFLERAGYPDRVLAAWKGTGGPVERAAWVWETLKLEAYRPGAAAVRQELEVLKAELPPAVRALLEQV